MQWYVLHLDHKKSEDSKILFWFCIVLQSLPVLIVLKESKDILLDLTPPACFKNYPSSSLHLNFLLGVSMALPTMAGMVWLQPPPCARIPKLPTGLKKLEIPAIWTIQKYIQRNVMPEAINHMDPWVKYRQSEASLCFLVQDDSVKGRRSTLFNMVSREKCIYAL